MMPTLGGAHAYTNIQNDDIVTWSRIAQCKDFFIFVKSSPILNGVLVVVFFFIFIDNK